MAINQGLNRPSKRCNTPTMQKIGIRLEKLLFIVATFLSSRTSSFSLQTSLPNVVCRSFHTSPPRSQRTTRRIRRYPRHHSPPSHPDHQCTIDVSLIPLVVSAPLKRRQSISMNLSFYDDEDKFYSYGNNDGNRDANQYNSDFFTSTTTMDSEQKFAAQSSKQATNNNQSETKTKQKRPQRNDKRKQKETQQENLYKILGADSSMTKPEIKKLYLTLAKQTHPDSAGYSPENIERFNRVARAYSILSDKQLRKRYDRELKANALTEEADEYMEEKKREMGRVLEEWYDELFIPFLTSLATGYFQLGRVGRDFGIVVLGIGGFLLVRWILVANFWLSWANQNDVGAK